METCEDAPHRGALCPKCGEPVAGVPNGCGEPSDIIELVLDVLGPFGAAIVAAGLLVIAEEAARVLLG